MEIYAMISLKKILSIFLLLSTPSIFGQSKYQTLAHTWSWLKYHDKTLNNSNISWDDSISQAVIRIENGSSETTEALRLISGLKNTNRKEKKKKNTISNLPISLQSILMNNPNEQIYVSQITSRKNQYVSRFSEKAYSYVLKLKEDEVINRTLQEQSIIAVFRQYAAIENFYPYQDKLDPSWHSGLNSRVQEAFLVSDTIDYYKLLLHCNHLIHDSHADLWVKPFDYFTSVFGKNTPKGIKFKMTNDTLFISTIDKEIYPDLNLGDYVTHVNEQSVDEYLKEKANLISMSYFSQNRLCEIIQITNDSIQNWTFHSKKGTFNSEIKFSPNRLSNFSQESPPVISLNTLYIDPSLITSKELNETLKNHLGASQWILDLRKTTKNLKSFEILEEFISKKNYHFVNLIIPNKYRAGTFQTVKQKTNGSNLYQGRVFVIVDSHTMSSAEYLTMALQSNPNVITIGEKTAGANGDVIEIPMPMNYSLRFSSLGVIYPDGKITQGEGVRIDEKFQPTISQYLRSSDPIFDYLLKKINE